jgi:hypothetical protein
MHILVARSYADVAVASKGAASKTKNQLRSWRAENNWRLYRCLCLLTAEKEEALNVHL